MLCKEKGQKKDEPDEEWAILDRKAIRQIRLSLAKIVTYNILKEKTTVDLMAALAKMYEQLSAANNINLMKKLFNLKMTEGCSFTSHLSKFNMIVNQLISVGIIFDDEVQALLIISQLPENWQGSVIVESTSTRKEKLKQCEVVSLILTKKLKRKSADLGSFSYGSTLMSRRKIKARKKSSEQEPKHISEKINQSLQCDLLKVNFEIVVKQATWLQAAKLQRRTRTSRRLILCSMH